MNDLYARRLAQTSMFHQLMRTHGTLWTATQVTHEPLDVNFVKEEFMRVNGRRAMPQLIGAAVDEARLHATHLAHVSEHCAWAESARAFAVRAQTPMTRHVAAMGRMAETVAQVRAAVSPQALMNETLSMIDGVATYEEVPVLDDDDGDDGEYGNDGVGGISDGGVVAGAGAGGSLAGSAVGDATARGGGGGGVR